jgi:hypothetical protein
MLAALGVRRVASYVLMNPAGDAENATRLIKALSRGDRRTLLWLPESGAPRQRGEKTGEWRPLQVDLRRLRALRLVEQTPEGWAANAAGLAARAALVATGMKEVGVHA